MKATCPFCRSHVHDTQAGYVTSTWQQWQCPHCGKWVDKDSGAWAARSARARGKARRKARSIGGRMDNPAGKPRRSTSLAGLRTSKSWSWGVGASSAIAIKRWPSISAIAMIRPSHEAGLWEWEVKVDGRVVADGNAKSSNHAKKWCTDTIGRMTTTIRRNPAVYAVTIGGSVVPGTDTHNRAHAWKWADRLTKQTGRKHSVGLKVGHRKVSSRPKGRLNNPSIGMPGMPHTWVTSDGTHVSGGDLIEFYITTPDGPRLRRARVNKMLVFEDHVMVNLTSMGTYVDEGNFVRVVRRAKR